MIKAWIPTKERILYILSERFEIGNLDFDMIAEEISDGLEEDYDKYFISYMDIIPLRELLIEFLIADPHKGMAEEEVDKIRNFLDQESKRRGFDSWIDAYHKL